MQLGTAAPHALPTEFTPDLRRHCIVQLDADGRVGTWNAGATSLSGYEPHEIIGASYESFFSHEDAAAGRPEEILRTAALIGQHEEEGWRVRRDGSMFWARVVITAIGDPRGELAGFGEVTEDLTEQRDAEEALNVEIGKLARSNEELRQFLRAAAHDLSEPLRSIAGYADLLSQRHNGALDDEAQRYLDRITANSVRLQTMIGDLLSYSHIGRHRLTMGPVNLASLVSEVVRELDATIASRAALVAVHDLPWVTADGVLIADVIRSLLTNALKFSDDPPRVEIGGAQTPHGWEIWVSDEGLGIPREHAERIFGLFQRLNDRERFSGNGLGLALAQRAVERHQGRLWVRSRPSGGSVFHFTLPFTDGPSL